MRDDQEPVALPPLGRVPYLPPTAWCSDHQGSRYSDTQCPNCVPLTELEQVANKAAFEREHGYS